MNNEQDVDKTCSVDGCLWGASKGGMCTVHYLQMWRYGKITGSRKRIPKKCSVEGCDRLEHMMGLCTRHHFQKQKYGEIRRTIYDRNEINDKGMYAELICEINDGKKIVSLIDSEDLPRIEKYKWSINTGGYLGNQKVGLLSRFLLGLPAGSPFFKGQPSLILEEVDHINRNRLDNRKSNLRVVSRLGNMQNKNTYQNNSTGTVGVGFHTLTGKWFYQINYGGVSKVSTLYDDKDTAIQKREANLILLKNSKNPADTFNQIAIRMKEEVAQRHRELYNQIEMNCAQCGKVFLTGDERRKREGKYCSQSCYWKSKKGRPIACMRKENNSPFK